MGGELPTPKIEPPEESPTVPRGRPQGTQGSSPSIEVVSIRGSSALRPLAPAVAGDEAARARGFSAASFALSTLGLLAQPILGGAVWLRVLMIVALLAMAAASAVVWLRAREVARYTRELERAYAAVALLTSIVFEYYLGVFSPAPVFVTLGIAFFALSSDRLVAVAMPVAAASAYAALGALLATASLPDDGVLHAADVPARTAFAITAAVATVQVLAMAQARVARRAMEEAIARSNDAVRERMRREAQLEDANRDLDQLLKMGANRAGAYTGVMAGKWVLGDLIGRGAMGEVYKATHTITGDQAAVKLLQPSMAADENVVARFFREGEAASKLVAPNVVSIYEVGRTADGSPYIAMELLRGHDLAWHLRQRGQLSLEEVVGVVEQVAAGLEAARVAGIVHRDLKPQNLFLAQQTRASPIWKILDFGVSRLLGSSGTLTQDQIVGTPGYMAPEQAAGKDATHRSDVFSFGVVVYRALTGQPPFTGPDTPQILYQVVYRNPARPSELVPSLPNDVDLALAVALAKDPEDRFASAVEMAAALKAAAKSELDASLRLHARTLLAALPWGASARAEESLPS